MPLGFLSTAEKRRKRQLLQSTGVLNTALLFVSCSATEVRPTIGTNAASWPLMVATLWTVTPTPPRHSPSYQCSQTVAERLLQIRTGLTKHLKRKGVNVYLSDFLGTAATTLQPGSRKLSHTWVIILVGAWMSFLFLSCSQGCCSSQE